LDVDTWRGVVTITGRATSEEEKAKAGTLAQSVKKVKEVRNLIDVVGADSVPQKVVRENIPFSKPAGKFAKPEEIALPTIDTNKKPATIGETELTEENKALATVTEDPVEQSSDAAVSSTPVDKDVTLQAEQELKELKAKKK
ncbi:MAG: BON domain-containing protein, partial [Deltaproteobacteria bacterium]|nr:BON domain-containing protein [Deltaproteobacteria bacterium]